MTQRLKGELSTVRELDIERRGCYDLSEWILSAPPT
jgi:hypothetical protein